MSPEKAQKQGKIDIFRGFVARTTKRKRTTAAAKAWTFAKGQTRSVRTSAVQTLIRTAVVLTNRELRVHCKFTLCEETYRSKSVTPPHPPPALSLSFSNKGAPLWALAGP